MNTEDGPSGLIKGTLWALIPSILIWVMVIGFGFWIWTS